MKKAISIVLAAAAALSLAACGGGGTAADPNAPIKVKFSVTFPATGTQADGANRLGELIAECSDGQMEMEFFYPSS